MNKIPYQLIRSKRRTIRLEITPEAALVVRAPRRTSRKEIERVINKKSEWVLKNLDLAQKKQLQIKTKKFEPGENFLFLGIEYPLELTETCRPQLTLSADTFQLSSRCQPKARKVFEKWYRQQAKRVLREQVGHHLSKNRLARHKPTIKITSAKKRWGSCNSKKQTLNFSWRLVMAPVAIVDYVVVHELAHLKYPNHSQQFWSEVGNILPNYKKAKRWLKDNGYKLVLP